MADSKGFHRGFLLGSKKRPKKKILPQPVSKKSSALLDLESPRQSIFDITEQESQVAKPSGEGNYSSNNEESPLLTAVRTNRKTQPVLFAKSESLLDDQVTSEGHGHESCSTLLSNSSVAGTTRQLHSLEGRPKWLLVDEPSRSRSQLTSELIDVVTKQDDGEFSKEIANTLLRMKRNSDWHKIGSNFVQSHLRTTPKRNVLWNSILEGDLTEAKSRLALCVLQDHTDLLISCLRELESKVGRCRVMRCLAIIEYQLAHGHVSPELVECVLPELGIIAKLDSKRTSLTQQAMEVAIKVTSAASLAGSTSPKMAKLLHDKISTVDQLLDTQEAWLGNNENWFTLEGARSWCKLVVIAHWQNVNKVYKASDKTINWCKELQGYDKHDVQIGSFASTFLRHSKFPVDNLIVLFHSLEQRGLSDEVHVFLTGFLAWLSRKGTRAQSGFREKMDCLEPILLDLLYKLACPVPLLAALYVCRHCSFISKTFKCHYLTVST